MKKLLVFAVGLLASGPAGAADPPVCKRPAIHERAAARPPLEVIVEPAPATSWIWSSDPFNYFGPRYYPSRVIYVEPPRELEEPACERPARAH